MKFRFFSDVAERLMLYQFPDLQFDDDNCVELDTPEQMDAASALGASQEPEPAEAALLDRRGRVPRPGGLRLALQGRADARLRARDGNTIFGVNAAQHEEPL